MAVGANDWVIWYSGLGDSHARSGGGCQDACAIWAGVMGGENCVLAAVADGHGAAVHDLSDRGASLAVKAALDELWSMVFENRVGSDLRIDEVFRQSICSRITTAWRKLVDGDAARQLQHERSHQRVATPYLRYGTTLLVAAIIGDHLLVGQIGDGNVDLASLENSVAMLDMLPRQGLEISNRTDSLAAENADQLWSLQTRRRADGGYLCLTTDGFGDSYPDTPERHKALKSICGLAEKHGAAQVSRKFPEWFDDISRRGSGDDISLVIVRIDPSSEVREKHTPAQGAPDGS